MGIMFLIVLGSSIRLKILVELLRWVNRFWKWRVRCVGMKDLRVSCVSLMKEEMDVLRFEQVMIWVRFSVLILHDGHRSFVWRVGNFWFKYCFVGRVLVIILR